MMPIDAPVMAIEVREDADSNAWVCLVVQNSAIKAEMYLCDGTNFRRAAAEFHDKILEAGKEAAKPKLIRNAPPLPQRNGGSRNGHVPSTS